MRYRASGVEGAVVLSVQPLASALQRLVHGLLECRQRDRAALISCFMWTLTTLRTTYGKIDCFFGQIQFKCYLPEEASVGDRPKICPRVASRVDTLVLTLNTRDSTFNTPACTRPIHTFCPDEIALRLLNRPEYTHVTREGFHESRRCSRDT